MGKIKIYELAKELDVASKEIVDKAKELGIQVSSHLSRIDEAEADKIKKSYSNKVTNRDNKKEEKKETKKTTKKEEPVIIRREIILSDEAENKKEETKKNETAKDIGFVKRRNNNDYNQSNKTTYCK